MGGGKERCACGVIYISPTHARTHRQGGVNEEYWKDRTRNDERLMTSRVTKKTKNTCTTSLGVKSEQEG